jgi:hypothetical protein
MSGNKPGESSAQLALVSIKAELFSRLFVLSYPWFEEQSEIKS